MNHFRSFIPLSLVAALIVSTAHLEIQAQAPDSPDRDTPPVIDETVVIGRPNSFPRSILGPDTVLTPGGLASSQRTTGNSITVIQGEALQKQGHTTVLDALRNQLGITTARSGGTGGLTSLFIRGSNSAHTKVLLDGIPLNDPSSASRAFDFGNLTSDNIERIEILRGPQSVLYGSDAMGGVVSFKMLGFPYPPYPVDQSGPLTGAKKYTRKIKILFDFDLLGPCLAHVWFIIWPCLATSSISLLLYA